MTFKEKKKYYIGKYMEAISGLSREEKEIADMRSKVALRLAIAEVEHFKNISAFNCELEPQKKSKLIQDLEASAIELGIARHRAKFYGLAV